MEEGNSGSGWWNEGGDVKDDPLLFDEVLGNVYDGEGAGLLGMVQDEVETIPIHPERRLTFEQVFDLLLAAESGRFTQAIPIRSQASPLCVTMRLFFVVSQTQVLPTEQERIDKLGDPNLLVPVKYQSFSNGEVWWSERHDYCLGVVARNMSRKIRSSKLDSQQIDHGFSGRWFSLLRRSSKAEPVMKSNCRSFVVLEAPSLVQFWTVDAYARKRRKQSKPEYESCAEIPPSPQYSSTGSTSDVTESSRATDELSVVHRKRSRGEDSYGRVEDKEDLTVRGMLRVEGDAVFLGDLSVKNLYVRGTLTVEGGINGQLVTPPEAADYAEWFAKLDTNEKIEAGDVVQLRSPEQRVSLQTDGNGPIMVVSTKPSVAAGVPFGASMHDGVLCGFIGQVPVNVIGPVEVGDLLVPSGQSDGKARAGKILHASKYEPLGTAMEACGPGEHTVLSFVRWAHNTKWKELRDMEEKHTSTTDEIWEGSQIAFVIDLSLFLALVTGVYVPQFNSTPVLIAFITDYTVFFWAALHFPQYTEFVYEVYFAYMVAFFRALTYSWLLYKTFLAEDPVTGPMTKPEILALGRDLLFLIYQLTACWRDVKAYRATEQSIARLLRDTNRYPKPFPSPLALFFHGVRESSWIDRKRALKAKLFSKKSKPE